MNTTTEYNILSPDGFTIRQEYFDSKEDAETFLSLWIKRFEKQGYYSTKDGNKIPWTKIPIHCKRINSKKNEDNERRSIYPVSSY